MFGIGELSKRTGCNIETIRFYEKNGLLPPPPRTAGGHRLYNDRHLQQLAFIVQARSLGFSLDHTRSLLALSKDTNKTCGDTLEMVGDQLDLVKTKIRALNEIKSSLEKLENDCRCCAPGTKAPECTVLGSFYQA